MAGALARIGLGLVFFGGIEAVDHYVSGLSVPWPVSLVVGICLGFGSVEALDEMWG